MNITSRTENEVHIVSIQGDLDATTVGEFDRTMREIIETGAKKIILDGAELHFIDSAALGRLVAILKEFRPAGGQIVLVALRASIRSTIEMIRLDRFMPIFASIADALAKIR